MTTDPVGNEAPSEARIEPSSSPGVTATTSDGPPTNDPTLHSSRRTTTTQPIDSHLSKNQLKKIRRWEKKMEIKQRRKEQERAARAARAKAVGRDLDRERQRQAEVYGKGRMRQEKQNKFKERLQQGSWLEVCIDGSFESSMTPKEINSLAKQIRYCYATNRRCCNSSTEELPCQITYTSAGGDTLKHLQNVSGFHEWKNLGFNYSTLPLEEYYKERLSQVVYLTSDSDNTLTELERDKVYVIGGIVDRNRLKRAALDRANTLGISTAKLPIDEHLKMMPSTRVLTCNHVFDLLVRCRGHNGDWKKALMDVLPTRKEAQFDDTRPTEEKAVASDRSVQAVTDAPADPE